MLETVTARVEKIYPSVTKKTKDGTDFVTQKVLIAFNLDKEFPSQLVLEQAGEKKIEVARTLNEGQTYDFSLNFRANRWTDPQGNETAFGSISAWKATPIEGEKPEAAGDLPF